MSRKTILLLALLASTTAAAGVAAPANAATRYCVLDPSGVTATVTPAAVLAPRVSAYHFIGPVRCNSLGALPQSLTIESYGNFVNQLGGTGTASSTDGSTNTAGLAEKTTVTGGTATISRANYTIDFVGGVGVLEMSNVNGVPSNSGRGLLQLRPKTGDWASGVSSFTLTGWFVVDF